MPKISERLADALQKFAADEEKFENGNKSAGTRARKVLQEIRQIASDGRKEIIAAREAHESKAA